MSGGVAYVFNENGNFDYYCNMGMVELSLVEDYGDASELTGLIKNHYNYTGSKKAKMILDDPINTFQCSLRWFRMIIKRCCRNRNWKRSERKLRMWSSIWKSVPAVLTEIQLNIVY